MFHRAATYYYALILFAFIAIQARAHAAIILQYHHVSSDTPASTSISATQFEQHLRLVQQQGFKVVPLSTIITALQHKKPLDDKWLAITFDDGFISVFTTARPLLKQFNYPYTVFLSPALIDKAQGPVMNWQQIKILQQEGVIIANHSSYHDNLAVPRQGESTAAWRLRVRQDIELAERQLKERLGSSPGWLAYPYGHFSAALEQLVTELGLVGIGQQSGAVGPGVSLTRIPRFPSAGSYAALDSIRSKLNTLAMPVTDYGGADPAAAQNPPTLILDVATDDLNRQALRCYFRGAAIPVQWLTAQRFSTTAEQPLRGGHLRYNCTAPSKTMPTRYYWFSQPWVYDANP
jgi:peptidoglycan/xylan/chitin deacetylase (PgdA/CDA1 family)